MQLSATGESIGPRAGRSSGRSESSRRSALSRCSPKQFAIDALPNGIAHRAVDGELLILGTHGFARVRKTPVQPLPGAKEDWAGLVGLVADGDHLIERRVDVALQRLARLPCDIDADLLHCSDGERPYVRRLSTGRVRLEPVTAELTQQALGYLASR